ncbi:MAG: DUF5058 family protein [Bacillota bacterium]|nr:DUF5058 family protein [Bacillota bacterium]MDW7729646.1 DUF5058 family protein [Bacillota bacterium]
MADYRNSTFMFVLGAIVALFVTVQSIVFLRKAWQEGKRRGIAAEVMRKTVLSSAVFTLVPSLSILLTMLTLSGALGLALPWIRLSVIGAVTYELPAAEAAAQAMGASLIISDIPVSVFSVITWVMTLGIMSGPIFIIFYFKKLQGRVNKIKVEDNRWGALLISAMFVGLISSFLGSALAGGVVSILTLFSSALLMVVCLMLEQKAGFKLFKDFALPLSMIGAMALAILYSNLLGGI